MICELVAKNFGGPSLTCVYREAKSETKVGKVLNASGFRDAKLFQEKRGHTGLFSLTVDATAIVQAVRARGNQIIGYANNEEAKVTSAQDIIDCVKQQKYYKACQAYAFLLVPLQPTIPSFTLAIQTLVKGKTADTVGEWMCNS